MWVFLALGSALLLGFYDVFKKVSLKGNAVIPVLAGSIFISAVLFAFCIVLSEMYPERMKAIAFYVPSIDWRTHLSIFIKASIVLGSWISAYFGMKYVPLTIFSPIRATQPIWTVLGAFIFFFGTTNINTNNRNHNNHNCILPFLSNWSKRRIFSKKQQMDMADYFSNSTWVS